MMFGVSFRKRLSLLMLLLVVNCDGNLFVLFSGLLGTAAFAFFCFYLLVAVVAGATMLGLKLVFITIHPMK